MGDWPTPILFSPSDTGAIGIADAQLGIDNTAAGGTAWPSANLAIFIPIRPVVPITITKLAVGAGATASGNFDVGIYDRSGNRLEHAGVTAKGASVIHVLDITDTRIGPGLYYLGLAANGTDSYVMRGGGTELGRAMGVLQMASGYSTGLVATATYAAFTQASWPTITAYTRSY